MADRGTDLLYDGQFFELFKAEYITTPHTQHGAHVRACLEAGLHVLVEKPMTTTARDARELIALAEKTGKVLAIGYQRHGDGKFIKARELVQAGRIGEIRLVHVIIAQDCLENFLPGASWRADPAFSSFILSGASPGWLTGSLLLMAMTATPLLWYSRHSAANASRTCLT